VKEVIRERKEEKGEKEKREGKPRLKCKNLLTPLAPGKGRKKKGGKGRKKGGRGRKIEIRGA